MKLYTTVLTVTAIAFASGIFFGCSQASSKVDEFEKVTDRISVIRKEISEKKQEIQDILTCYNNSNESQEPLRIGFEEGYIMSPDELAALDRHLEMVDDDSYRSLLENVRSLNGEIEGLHREMSRECRLLPPSQIVKKGDNHYSMCLQYLMTEHGLSRAEANDIARSARLMPNILEGFEVWFMYDQGRLATFVGQGSACMTPEEFAATFPHRLQKECPDEALDTEVSPMREDREVLVGSGSNAIVQ